MLAHRISTFAAVLAVGLVLEAVPAEAGSGRTAPDPRVSDFSAQSRPPIRRARPRIEIYPGRLLYRQCVDGYREVLWPDGVTRVIMPYMHCRWVRG